ncbi:MAG: aldehyde dehydrogenase family protein [Halolamina sp.]|uniref:aldehyde dehydrogenase family protein n=1 Tax=Halolamina sp. TaxID=1940283 RepID=UPI002FC3227B
MSNQLTQHGPYVGGERVAGGETLTTRNPGTGEVIATVETADGAVVDDAVAAAREAFPDWRDTDPDRRGRIVYRVGQLVREHRDELATLESRDQGKPRSQAHSDMGGAARYFEYYAGAADKLEGRSVPVGTGGVDYTIREPYGVSAQVTPWNFPGNLFARGVAPALVAGNTVVVKPAPQTPLSSLRLAELCSEAGVPDGVVNVVPGAGDTGEKLVGHDGVDQVTFTGSVPTGQAIMRESASHVRPVTLELGGKNPALVYPDADIEEVADEIATGIFTNAGQVCSASDRAVVHESVVDEFLDVIVERAENYELGPNADMGPLCSREQFERVVDYIEVGETEGARLVTGGGTPEADPGGNEEGGFYVEPTVFADVDPEMRIAQEEIFGPVLTVLTFSDTEEAVDIANGTEYGLTAGVFTGDVSRAHTLARRLEAGNVYINGWFGDTNQTPFGGYGKSGIGREKGLEALESYLQTKNVAVDLGEGGTLPGA